MAQCRYVYYPMTAKRIGRRVTVLYRIRKWLGQKRTERPDVYPVTGFYPPYYPGK